MYGVFTFRSVKSLAGSVEASVSGVMFVQRPPFAWTTVPSERPEAGVPVPGWLERRAHPAMTAMSATTSPDPSSTNRCVDADPAGRPPAVPGRAAETAFRGVFAVARLLLRLLNIVMVSFDRMGVSLAVQPAAVAAAR